MKRKFCNLVILCLFSAGLGASPGEDLYGAGARVQALGGAGVAFSKDPSAAYYNPANLARCPKKEAVIGYGLVSSNLSAFQTAPESKPLDAKHVGNYHLYNLGVCYSPFSRFNFGFYTSGGLEIPLQFGALRTITNDPYFVRFDESLKAPSVIFSGAFEPIEGFVLGAGVSASAGIQIIQDVFSSPGSSRSLETNLTPQVFPMFGLIAGIRADLIKDMLSLGMVYRQPSFNELNVAVDVSVFHSITQRQIKLQSAMNYSPPQFAIGLLYSPHKDWKLGLDTTIKMWSHYKGPFIRVKGQPEDNNVVDFEDIIELRLGAEHQLNEKVNLRAGYAVLPAVWDMANLEKKDLNLLTNTVHQVTFGVGYLAYKTKDVTLMVDSFLSLSILAKKNVLYGHTSTWITTPEPKRLTFGGSVLNAGLSLKADF